MHLSVLKFPLLEHHSINREFPNPMVLVPDHLPFIDNVHIDKCLKWLLLISLNARNVKWARFSPHFHDQLVVPLQKRDLLIVLKFGLECEKPLHLKSVIVDTVKFEFFPQLL